MNESRSDDAGSEAAVSETDAHGRRAAGQGTAAEEPVSRLGMLLVPSAFQRRSMLQRQQEVTDCSTPGGLHREGPERGSLTPAMRKKYLKELLFGASSNSGFSSALSSHGSRAPSSAEPEPDAGWALYPVEHAWMLSAVEGNYDTLLEFITEDPHLLNRRDFISGYSVLHWLAKRGRDDSLLRLVQHAQAAGMPANVNLRGSGGLTPLHVASMHGHYMVVKLLVGAFGADVDVMDYSGRRAWQYLRGDAPPEMRELLGTWDDEHSCGLAQPDNKNVNNNSAGCITASACDEVDAAGQSEEGSFFDRTKRGGSWRFGSLRSMLPTLSFLGRKK